MGGEFLDGKKTKGGASASFSTFVRGGFWEGPLAEMMVPIIKKKRGKKEGGGTLVATVLKGDWTAEAACKKKRKLSVPKEDEKKEYSQEGRNPTMRERN